MTFIQLRQKRLRELKKQRPQFSEIYDFYTGLYDFFARQQEPFMQLKPDLQSAERRWHEGFPLLCVDSLQIDVAKAIPFLGGLVDLFNKHGQQGKQELATLKAALTEGRLDILALLRACLARERRTLDEQASQVDVTPALLEYLFATALSYALQLSREAGLAAPTDNWKQGYCPLCGGLPGVAELTGDEGQRRLHCATCATSWEFPRLKCCYCGTTDRDALEYFTAEGDPGHRVDVCRKCCCYLKGVDSRELGEGLPMDLEDFSTLHLDLLAQREGFTRGKQSSPG